MENNSNHARRERSSILHNYLLFLCPSPSRLFALVRLWAEDQVMFFKSFNSFLSFFPSKSRHIHVSLIWMPVHFGPKQSRNSICFLRKPTIISSRISPTCFFFLSEKPPMSVKLVRTSNLKSKKTNWNQIQIHMGMKTKMKNGENSASHLSPISCQTSSS